MRVVLDTNVLISSLLWSQGIPARVVALARQGRIHSVTSSVLLEELRRVLEEKMGFPPESLREALEIVIEHSEIVAPLCPVQVIQADPDDDRVLECAVEGKAEAIVTGDQHLLKLESFQSIPIVTPREFLSRFKV